MPPRNQSGIGGKLGPQSGANVSGPSVGPAPVNRPKTPKAPKVAAPPQAAQGFLNSFMQNPLVKTGGKILSGGLRVFDATEAANPNLPNRDRGIAAGGVVHPMLGMALGGMAWMDDQMTALTGVSSDGPGRGRGSGYKAFESQPITTGKVKQTNDNWADPVAGKGPKGNQVGSEVDKSTWSKPAVQQDVIDEPDTPSEGSGGDTTKVSPTGIVQKGKSLSSANASLAALGIGPLQDASRFINGGQGFKIETAAPEGTKAEDVDFSTDDAVAFGMTEGEANSRAAGNTIETVITPTSAGTTGKDASDPEEGISSKPNNADKVRAVRFKRRDGAMSFNGADFSGDEPDNSNLTSPMYANSARNAARSAFLDAPAGQGVMGAIRARDAAVGVHEDGVLLNGKFREWAPGVDAKTKAKARYAATGGAFGTKEGLDEWTGQFLAPDSEATPETATPQTEQEFDLSGVDEATKKLVGMTQSPLMSKDIPEMSSQEEADKFLTSWRKKAGLSR